MDSKAEYPLQQPTFYDLYVNEINMEFCANMLIAQQNRSIQNLQLEQSIEIVLENLSPSTVSQRDLDSPSCTNLSKSQEL